MSGARDQVTRLLALAPYLQARGGVPLSRVAADFGVTPKQIVKDLNVLWMCGLPGQGPGDLIEIDLEALEDDPDGVVRIDNADYLARPIRLGSSEASALIVALRALREGSPESAAASREVIDRTLAKLEDAAATGNAHVDVHLPAAQPRIAEVAGELREAIDADRQVRLEYYVPTRDETTSREVDPIAVLRSDNKDYLDAWCHVAEARRLFRVSRIQSVQVLGTPRERVDVEPRDLSEGLFEPGADDELARIRLAPGLSWFVEYYPVTSSRPLDDGGLEVELRVSDPMWLVRLALRLAPGLTVLEPTEIRDRATATAQAALSLYGDGGVA